MYTAGPSGVVTVPCLSNPAFVARIARKLLGDGSSLDLVTSGSLNSNSELEPAFPSLAYSCDAFASDWSIPRTRIGFFPLIRPVKSNVRLGIPNRLSIQHCNVWSDGLLR